MKLQAQQVDQLVNDVGLDSNVVPALQEAMAQKGKIPLERIAKLVRATPAEVLTAALAWLVKNHFATREVFVDPDGEREGPFPSVMAAVKSSDRAAQSIASGKVQILYDFGD